MHVKSFMHKFKRRIADADKFRVTEGTLSGFSLHVYLNLAMFTGASGITL